jgi:hypothetical protein
MIRELARRAGRGEDVELPARDRTLRMDSAGMVDEELAGCTGCVADKLLFDHIPLRSGQLLRYEPVNAHKLMGIEGNVLLPAADITTPAAGKRLLVLFSASLTVMATPVSATA